MPELSRLLPPRLLHTLLVSGLVALCCPAAPASEPGEPFLVRDIETTGEPFFEECHILCPPPPAIHGSMIEQLTPLGERVVFIANDRTHGFEPWVSDGTAEGTRLLADSCPGECFDRVPRIVGVLEGQVYFWAPDPDGNFDLWVTDGTAEGTRALTEACPGLCDAWDHGPAVDFGGYLFVMRRKGIPSDPELWRTDGTLEGTAQVLDECARFGGCARAFFVYGGRLFFDDGFGLRRLDEAEGVPVEVWGGEVGSAARLGDRMILGVDGSSDALAVMDDPLAEPSIVTHLDGGGQVSRLTSAGDLVYFVRSDSFGAELWRTDGTAEGTEPVVPELAGHHVEVIGVLDGGPVVRVDPDPGDLPVVLPTLWRVAPDRGAEALIDAPVHAASLAGDRVFFSAPFQLGFDLGRELWVSDGTAAGTELHADVAPGSHSADPGNGGRRMAGFVRAGDRLFFPASHPDADTELWALELNVEEEPPPGSETPPPPSDEWIEADALPGFRVQVRITGGPQPIAGSPEPCIPETLCVSGAVPGRPEVFVRIVGPKPNGFLWPTLVKFSTSTVEVWIEQEATGELRYYQLEGATPGADELPGLFDRDGFEP